MKNLKSLMIALAAFAVGGVAHAITSDEIAAALDVDPSIGTFSTDGFADWYVDTSSASCGASCIRSGAIPNNGSWRYSTLYLSLEIVEVKQLSFRLKTHTYNNSNDSYLSVVCDQANSTYTGDSEWRTLSITLLPGHHNISFQFGRRNYYSSDSSYCAWLDEFKLLPILAKKPTVEITNIACTQRTPWNGKVDIDYTLTCDKSDADIWVYPVGYDKDANTTMAPRALEGEGVNAPVKSGTHRMTWTVTDDYPNFNSTAFTVKMTALVGAAPYMVVDLAGGVDALSYPVTYISSVPDGGWGDEYKTTKLVLRLIPSGCFQMGSPSDENGRGSYEDLHGVVLTRPFYIGVFECTQKQYQLVMGATPSSYKGDLRPVENVSYGNIRGSVNGLGWPTHNQVDADSFMGRLRSKVNMLFDLPTEAEWEYACRAGTATALNNGTGYTESNLKLVARCSFNTGDGKGGYSQHTKVGSYLDNSWGLYDMHGNVMEWCRDYHNRSGLGYWGSVDPKGSATCYQYYGDGRNCNRIAKGGYFNSNTSCRSASRSSHDSNMYVTSSYGYVGFRVYCLPVAQ